jgi:tRNA-binding EMAP/Myf-like protein
MNSAPIKPLISTPDLDEIDVRIGAILAVEDVAHSETLVCLPVDFGDHARAPFSSAGKSSGHIQRRLKAGRCCSS